MITKELLNPKSIVIVGASNDIAKPGGKILYNIITHGYKGRLYTVNLKERVIQGLICASHVSELDNVELAILAVAAKFVPEAMEILVKEKKTRAFIVLSAGFSEMGEEGRLLEERIVEIAEQVGACLIGPNCIGILNTSYAGIFAGPIPKLSKEGCDFVSGSGATAVFILETAIPMGIKFASLFSVGNSAQIGVEDVLEYWDLNFDAEQSSKVKLIYVEQINNPRKFLRHASSLINKGCGIAAIKAGTTDAGSRAVSSHTGALAGSDAAVEALFKKAGIARCYGREELAYAAGILKYKRLKGDRIAIITHAGGPGVMLTDTLSKGGLKVPHIEGAAADELLGKLFPGSSVANPIDLLATGTAEQLGIILDYCDKRFDNIDASAVIFGSSGLFDVAGAYDVLNKKINTLTKPIYPILPSIVQAIDAIEHFKSYGKIYFQDEVVFGEMLARIYNTPKPAVAKALPEIHHERVRKVIENAADGFLPPDDVQALLDSAGILRAAELNVYSAEEAAVAAKSIGFPIVMKVVGPVHKTDVGGVRLNIQSAEESVTTFDELMKIEDAKSVLIQKMLTGGIELYAGAKLEDKFGHIILCGLGGIFIETIGDVAAGLSPLNHDEALSMFKSLKAYKILKGARGGTAVDEEKFADIIVRLSALLEAAPEIMELDLNPLLGFADRIVAVDARIRIQRQQHLNK